MKFDLWDKEFSSSWCSDECYKYISAVMPNDIEELERQFKENEKSGGTAAFLVESIGQDRCINTNA